jgi:N,N'-diacetyllegionaminate synthase
MINRTLIIAEAGVNHNGSIDLAKKLIDAAAEAGVDYVKFQTFKAETLVSKNAKKAEYQVKNIGDNDDSQYAMLKKLELDQEMHKLLINYCKTKNIKFLSTAFDLESVDLLSDLGIDLFKIPSGEITNLPYLQKIGSLGKPVILSTGMANLGEIEAALEVLVNAGTAMENITVLHCNTEYPTPMQDVNLTAMLGIKEAFKVKVGYSDHTLGIEIPTAAVALGAVCIEKHFTLDKTMEGPDHKASLEPDELKAMVSAIRNIELALGDGVKKPSVSERKNLEVARKSIHVTYDLPEGHVLTLEDLIMKRPGNGISPMVLNEVIGKQLLHHCSKDHILSYSDFK